jgi:hypothetical protein
VAGEWELIEASEVKKSWRFTQENDGRMMETLLKSWKHGGKSPVESKSGYIYISLYICMHIYIYIQCIHSFQSKTMEHGGNMMEALWSNGNNTQYMESDGR